MFERTLDEGGTTDLLKELGIGLIAYSPLGRGFLSGQLKNPNDLDINDARRNFERFQGDNFYKNLDLVKEMESIADQKQVSASQLALAWIISKGHIPIPGTRQVKNAEQNIAAANIVLSAQEIEKLESILPLGNQQAGSRAIVNASPKVEK